MPLPQPLLRVALVPLLHSPFLLLLLAVRNTNLVRIHHGPKSTWQSGEPQQQQQAQKDAKRAPAASSTATGADGSSQVHKTVSRALPREHESKHSGEEQQRSKQVQQQPQLPLRHASPSSAAAAAAAASASVAAAAAAAAADESRRAGARAELPRPDAFVACRRDCQRRRG